ncbi:MAG: RtcB family protein [Acidobacteria bacterium]|nr:RtcB family protein [Acidobacteriota bacterium]
MSITTYGDVDERSRRQLQTCIEVAEQLEGGQTLPGVLCADHHPGYSQPIGGVVAYRRHISPSGVGYDIACGNMAARTNIQMSAVSEEVPRLMDEIWARLSFGMGRKNAEPVDHPVLEEIAQSDIAGQRSMAQLAAAQLGTVGSGNHYVDLFRDEDGWVWIGVHFGSRGFGHKTCKGFLALAQNKRWGDNVNPGGMDAPPVLIDTGTDLGADYVQAMETAGRYAYAGREWVVNRVAQILGATLSETVHNHHNFAWRETHGGEDFWVMRKGATPAFPDQRGFVGGSMGEISVVLEGVDSPDAARSLYSTVHGAGRVMSRSEAAGRVIRRNVWACNQRNCDGTLPIQTPLRADGANPRCLTCGAKTRKHHTRDVTRVGRVDWPSVKAGIQAQGIELRGAGADEAPEVYKRLPDVLAAHGDTIRTLHTLHPIGVAMAATDEFDPYKD